MQRLARESAVVFAVSFTLCSLILLFAQGRIFSRSLLDGPLAKPVGDGCFMLSLPGVILAVAIWGYNSSRTLLSDVLVVTVNATLYATPIILLVHWVRHRKPSQ